MIYLSWTVNSFVPLIYAFNNYISSEGEETHISHKKSWLGPALEEDRSLAKANSKMALSSRQEETS